MLGVTDQDCWAVANAGPAFTLLAGETIIGAGGLAPKWKGSAVAWALIGVTAGRYWIMVHRFVRHVLDAADYQRIECVVEHGFSNGHRWAVALGFEHEGLMRMYRDGRDFDLYARVR